VSYEAWLQETVEKLSGLPSVGGVLERALTDAPKTGTWVEFGVADGVTLRQIVAARGGAKVWGFDTFTGLPEAWTRKDHLAFAVGHFRVEAIPLIPEAHLVSGRFEDTLPAWRPPEQVTFAHIDCDIYSGARCALRYLGPLLADGAIIVFDELWNYPGFEAHEVKALYEAEREDGLEYDWLYIFGGNGTWPNERAALKVRK
jgi:hypothetical protein